MIVHACISIGVGFGFRGVPLTLNLCLERDKLAELFTTFTWEKELLKPTITFCEPTNWP